MRVNLRFGIALLSLSLSSNLTQAQSCFSGNLLDNGGSENGINTWTFTGSGDNGGWMTIPYSGLEGGNAFFTSYGSDQTKTQTIDLLAEGFSANGLDSEPEIFVKESFIGSWPNYADRYTLTVTLEDENHAPITSYTTGELHGSTEWQTASHIFSGYGTGVRYITFQTSAYDAEFWAGFYGTIVDGAEVRIANTTIGTSAQATCRYNEYLPGVEGYHYNTSGTYVDIDTSNCSVVTTTLNIIGPSLVADTGTAPMTVITDCAADNTEWTYYGETATSGTYHFAINWGANNAAAEAAAMVTLDNDSAYTEAHDVTDGIWTMKRYWNVDLGTESLNEGVSVRFFYNPADTTDLHTALVNAGFTDSTSIRWFKTIDTAFSPELVTPTNINDGNIITLNPIYGMINGQYYVQFDNVNSFSGGTAGLGAGAGNNPLAIDLISFSAVRNTKGSVETKWSIGSEHANTYTVQRSTDARSFTAIGTVTSNGKNNYAFTDNAAPESAVYYRLAMVDASNKTEYSNVVKVQAIPSRGNTTVSPVPTTSTINIKSNATADFGKIATITDVTGRIVTQFALTAATSIDVQSWPTGLYILSLPNGSTQKIVKQ